MSLVIANFTQRKIIDMTWGNNIPMRDFVMLAKPFESEKAMIQGWWWSEKYDGKRCLSDGGVTRNKIVRDIPWANKGNRERIISRATGLWSRYGNVITAPDWFIDGLPKNIMLDGELWMGRNLLQPTMSIVQSRTPDKRWLGISFLVFDRPSLTEFVQRGMINNPHFQLEVDELKWSKFLEFDKANERVVPFQLAYQELQRMELAAHVKLVKQTPLPYRNTIDEVYRIMDDVVARGGEGIMLRRPFSYWTPKRSNLLLKVKPLNDAEGTVIGYEGGLGKYKGMLGAIIMKWVSPKSGKTIQFKLGSGLSDGQRDAGINRTIFGQYGGLQVPAEISLPQFPLGATLTFDYVSETKDNVPREGRNPRLRSES